MKWFLDMKTGGKIIVSLGLLLIFNILVIGFAYATIGTFRQTQNTLFSRDFLGSLDLVEFRGLENRIRALHLELFLTKDRAAQQKIEADIETATKSIYVIMESILAEFENDPAVLAKIGDINVLRSANKQIRDSQIALLKEGKLEEAVASALGSLKLRYDEIRGMALELGARSKSDAFDKISLMENLSKSANQVFILIGVLSILLSALLTVANSRAIAVPLSRLTGMAEILASGDLSADLGTSKRKDEIGALFRSLARMVDSLRGIAVEIKDGVGILAASSSEILATTCQVAIAATQTAAAVNETTTAVEEVKQVARMANDKSRNVSTISQNASRVAQEGYVAVESNIERMANIKLQVEAIAERVSSLSEQGQAIGEIIETVGNFAEQTNLLAVNAAIEAAKAGEQGKGFAVVAQEVRSLAEQSKSATAQVRAILNDVKKATDLAIMASEQGGKAVEAGTLQASKAGEAIRLIGETIEATAQAALQIAASSQQQMIGMDQVALAMENIREASEQNVGGMKKVEVTVQALHDLGQKLKG
ncbi:MAG: methyl-accepting chemotaxis protein, partial [Spirochaetaceae bacterium]|nr:methyl-accepting chemotaxis protein [Spirochaetaceae bacterium]